MSTSGRDPGGGTGRTFGAKPAVALTVAGLDPSGGAGIIADVKTFTALGAYAAAVTASITFQNTRGVSGRHDLPPRVVGRQLEVLLEDLKPGAVKTGVLGEAVGVSLVAEMLAERGLRPVVDPVITGGDGTPLLTREGLDALSNCLVPAAALVTPNVEELAILGGRDVVDLAGVKEAALMLVERGAGAVLATGLKMLDGTGAFAVDILLDGDSFEIFRSPWIEGGRIHGTGCVLSAAVTALMALGAGLREAVRGGRDFVAASMRHAVRPGAGVPCADPMSAAGAEV